MNTKTILILAVVGAILLGVGLSMRSGNTKAWSESTAQIGEEIYPDFPLNDVDKIEIKDSESTLTLSQTDDGWIVDAAHGYFAKSDQVGRLLKAIYDLELKHNVEVGESFYHRLDLAATDAEKGAGIEVTFYQADSQVAQMRLGKDHTKQSTGGFGGGSWPDGKYILNPATQTVAVVSETFSQVKADQKSWLDTDFVKVKKPKRGTAKQGDAVLWEVSRANEADSLALLNPPEGKEVDTSKVSNIDWALNYPRFDSIAVEKGGDESAFGFAEGRTFELETFEGFTYTLHLGTTIDGKVPVKVDIAYDEPAAPEAPEEAEAADDAAKSAAQQAHQAALDKHNEAVEEARGTFKEQQTRYAGWVFLLPMSTVDDYLYNLDELLKEPEPAEGEESPAEPTEDAPGLPGLIPPAGDATDLAPLTPPAPPTLPAIPGTPDSKPAEVTIPAVPTPEPAKDEAGDSN